MNNLFLSVFIASAIGSPIVFLALESFQLREKQKQYGHTIPNCIEVSKNATERGKPVIYSKSHPRYKPLLNSQGKQIGIYDEEMGQAAYFIEFCREYVSSPPAQK